MSSWREFLLRVFWYGGSTFDAWLNISAAKMATRILTMPQTLAQMGLPFAIVLSLAQIAMGIWTQCIIKILYLKHISTVQTPANLRRHTGHKRHVTQLHEVIGGLLSRRWGALSLLFNVSAIFCVSFIQLIACGNVVYIINDRLDKRTWTCILSAIFCLSIFIPSAHNYRVWSFIGVLTTIFASVYLTTSCILHAKDSEVKHSTPHSFREFYDGVSGSITLGHVAIPVEIMDAMWKPQEYHVAYIYAVIYIFVVAMVPAISLNINFGDELLAKTNSLYLFSPSRFRDATVVLLLVHVFINFGMFSLALSAMWEKLVGVHESPSYAKRTLCRVPVFIALWVTAIAFPFFGIVSKLVDSALATWNVYIIPCAAYNLVFWPKAERKRSKPLSRLSWAADFSVNLGIILWVVLVESGLGSWADIRILLKSKGFHVFAKCSGC